MLLPLVAASALASVLTPGPLAVPLDKDRAALSRPRPLLARPPFPGPIAAGTGAGPRGEIVALPSTFCSSDDGQNPQPAGCTAYADPNCTMAGAPPAYELAPQDSAIDAVAQFFQAEPDQYDTIVFWRDYLQDYCTGLAYYFPIFNDVDGIGAIHFSQTGSYQIDLRPYFGVASGGTLRGLIDMGMLYDCSLDQMLGIDCGDGQTFPTDAYSLPGILGQESAHQWGAFVHFTNGAGQDDASLLGRSQQHWSWFFDTGGGDGNLGSPLEGNLWTADGGDFSIPQGSVAAYSPLDQYLMGVRPASDVPPFFYVANPAPAPGQPAFKSLVQGEGPGSDPPYGPAFSRYEPDAITGQAVQVTIDQVQAAENRRQPAFGSAPFVTTQAWTFLLQPGESIAQAATALARVEALREFWTGYFYQATDRRMRVITTLEGRDDLPLFTFHVSGEGFASLASGTVSVDPSGGLDLKPGAGIQNLNVLYPAGSSVAALLGGSWPKGAGGQSLLSFTQSGAFASGDSFTSTNPVDGRHYAHRILYFSKQKGASAQAATDWSGTIEGIELQPSVGSSGSEDVLVDHLELTASPPPDQDGDGVADDEDDCPKVANPDQADYSGKGVGYACDPAQQARFNPDGTPRPAGCGCSSGGSEAFVAGLFLLGLGLRRRRRA